MYCMYVCVTNITLMFKYVSIYNDDIILFFHSLRICMQDVSMYVVTYSSYVRMYVCMYICMYVCMPCIIYWGIAGNTVWGLHNCGVVWLPAVVERIYPAPPDGLG